MMRVIKYFFTIFLLFIVFVSIVGLIIARYYQDEVKQLMISQVNKYIQTEVKVGDLSFSVLRKFPSASIEFRDVLIMVPEEYNHNGSEDTYSDTLFTAQSLFLQFNLKNIFNRDYKIKTIHAINGVLYLAVNENEKVNYRFWDTSVSSGDGFELDLQDVRLNNYRLKYANAIKEIYFDSDIGRLDLKGNFSQSSFRLRAIATGGSRYFRHQRLLYFSEIPDISISTTLNFNNELITIEEGTVDFSGIRLKADGIYKRSSPGELDIILSGYNLDIASVIPLLPEKTRKSAEPWKFSGRFDFDISASGIFTKTVSPSLVASFNSESGEITRKDTGMSFKNISMAGYYTNGRLNNITSSKIAINQFYASIGNGSIRGSGSFSNLMQPDVSFDINADFLMEEISEFYRPPNIHQIAGRINTKLSVNGQLQTLINGDIDELNKLDIEGMMIIENGKLEISEGKYIASGIDGKLDFGKILRTPGLSFFIGSDHFSIKGEIDNGLPWLLGDDQTMRITGGLFSRQLYLDNYIKSGSDHLQSEDDNESLLFPANLELNLDFKVEDLKFRNFESSGFSGKLSYKPRMLTLNAVEFISMDGSVSGNGVIHQRINGDFLVRSQLQMQEVDMQKMFFAFNNFGQTFIHGDNLKGSLSGSLGFTSEWRPDLKLISEKIVANSKVEIRDGELIDFEPMLGLARFIDISELQHVSFSTLQNEIFIRDRVVTIPQMNISSSAFDISGSGVHRFDGHFDYRMSVLLSDVLYGKARRTNPENSKFGIVEDDGLGKTSLYLLVSGTSDDYQVSYDQRTVRNLIKDNIANEKNVLKQLLHEEFGWFSSDSINAAAGGSSEASGDRFIISWDEEDEKQDKGGEIIPTDPSSEPSLHKESTRKERSFKVIWDEEEEPGNEP